MNVYQISKNARNEIELDYNIARDCSSYDCDGVCRCGKIVDIKIKKIDRTVVNSLVEKIRLRKNAKLKQGQFVVDDEQFFMYCIDRLFTIDKLYDNDSWDVKVCRGYYGEEIESVSAPLSFSDDVIKIAKLDPQQRIKYVLTREYGYLHDRLKYKYFIERTVSTQQLVVGNEYRKIEDKLYEEGHNLPIGIYLKDDSSDKYILMDGYNRFYNIVPNNDAVQIISAE